MAEGLTLVLVLAAVAVWLLVAHGRLIRAQSGIYDKWAAVEDVLEKRDALIVALGHVAAGRLGRDEKSGARVARLAARCREAYGAHDVARAEQALTAEVADLLHVVALTPGMLGDPEAADLPGRISRLDGKVAQAAAEYNNAARQLNVMIEVFPSRLVARIFGFGRTNYFEREASDANGGGKRV